MKFIIVQICVLFMYYQLKCQEFIDNKQEDEIVNVEKQEKLDKVPIFRIDTCFYNILDKIVDGDSLRVYYRPKVTGYVFYIQQLENSISITATPKYIDKIIRNQSLFGAIIYKNRTIICVGDYANDILTEIQDSIQINYITDERDMYWGSDFDGILNIVNCSNIKIYFYLRDLVNESPNEKGKKRKKKKGI